MKKIVIGSRESKLSLVYANKVKSLILEKESETIAKSFNCIHKISYLTKTEDLINYINVFFNSSIIRCWCYIV